MEQQLLPWAFLEPEPAERTTPEQAITVKALIADLLLRIVRDEQDVEATDEPHE